MMQIHVPDAHTTTGCGTCSLPDFPRVLPILTDLHTAANGYPTLTELHATLVAPVALGVVAADVGDVITIDVVPPESSEAAIARHMLTYGYCAHYFTGEGEPELPEEPHNPQYQQYTLVATCSIQHTPMVVGTLQAIVGCTVPALALFQPSPDTPLPHLATGSDTVTNGLIGELRRFSINPLLEAGPFLRDDPLKAVVRNYRSLLYRALYTCSLQIFRAMDVHFVYGIATPEIYRFFTRGGMTMSVLETMQLAQNDEVRMLQQVFALYWRPQAPHAQQPALYRIHVPILDAPVATG